MNERPVPEGQGPQAPRSGLVVAPMVRIDPRALEIAREDLELLGQFVKDVLKPDIDWGTIPGLHTPSLWEPGADRLISAYQSYSRPVVLRSEIDEGAKYIFYMIQAEVVVRSTGAILAAGIGVASTREGRYGSRWVASPQDYGLDPKVDRLQKRTNPRTGRVAYHIPNPDWGDLVHTLVQMAYKRAKVDAAQSLPGASSALRQLFLGKAGRAPEATSPRIDVPGEAPDPGVEDDRPTNWTAFWAEMRALGLSTEQVYQKLRIKSLIKDWINKGHSLAEARGLLLGMEGDGNETPSEP